jgi:hypothetical protein
LKKLLIAIGLMCVAAPALAQDYRVSVYAPSAQAPLTTVDVPATATTCNLAASPTQPVNPIGLEWTDPANTGRVCRWTDQSNGPLLAAPIGAYEVTLRNLNAAGPGPESNRASFSRLAPPTTAPAGVRPVRPGS